MLHLCMYLKCLTGNDVSVVKADEQKKPFDFMVGKTRFIFGLTQLPPGNYKASKISIDLCMWLDHLSLFTLGL